jgi:hypothetical protein
VTLAATHEHNEGDRAAWVEHGFECFGTVIRDHTGEGARFVQVTPDGWGTASLFVPRSDFTWTDAQGPFTAKITAPRVYAVGIVYDGDEEWPDEAQHFGSLADALAYCDDAARWGAGVDAMRVYGRTVGRDDSAVLVQVENRTEASACHLAEIA